MSSFFHFIIYRSMTIIIFNCCFCKLLIGSIGFDINSKMAMSFPWHIFLDRKRAGRIYNNTVDIILFIDTILNLEKFRSTRKSSNSSDTDQNTTAIGNNNDHNERADERVFELENEESKNTFSDSKQNSLTNVSFCFRRCKIFNFLLNPTR